jgi:copper(I)-binding protein
MTLWWTTKAFPWLQKNWQWVLLPVGILMFVARAFLGQKIEVVASQLSAADAAVKKAQDQATAIINVAEVKREARLAEVQKEHAEVIKILTDQQKDDMAELMSDPEVLNNYLLEVGKRARQ